MQGLSSNNSGKISVSFEFFPPKTEAMRAKLMVTIDKLLPLKPSYFSVTYGAGGSGRDNTMSLVKYLHENIKANVAPHLTCVGQTKDEIDNIAKDYWAMGVRKIVALRGDMPGLTQKYQPTEGSYEYADSLVAALKKIANFDIEVAAYPEGHPEAESLDKDVDHLYRKQQAGADKAITQYCFDTDQILKFIDQVRKRGITMPVVPGILNIANIEQTVQFSQRCGATVPVHIIDRFKQYAKSQEDSDKLSSEIAIEQCQKLKQAGINEFHFYCLNRFEVASTVCRNLY